MTQVLSILKEYWGFDSFKPSQERVIDSVLKGRDTIALLPTGGGKSICFQVPALLKDGICIVISPLVALMQDQVNVLKSKNIKAMALSSGMHYSDLDKALDNCIYGNYKFLYLSPERLQQDIVQARLKNMPVNLIAIDEAHCISQWGHDFRPAYRNVNILRELHPSIPVIALTATATSDVVEDMGKELDLYQPQIIKQSFKRENLTLKVIKVNDKHQELFDALQGIDGAAIVYLKNRKGTVDISNVLNSKGMSATFFHGGISTEEKSNRLAAWLNDEVKIMVATNAFGMGIDKPNVRRVIHYNLTDSLESYYQEAGRAGRDQKHSEAIVIYNDSDIILLENMFLKYLPTVDSTKHIYAKLNSYFGIAYGEGEGESFGFNFYEFCQRYNLSTLLTYEVLRMMDRASIITMVERYNKKCEVQFLLSNRQLLDFLEENPKYEGIVKAILRSYGGVFEAPVSINLVQIVNKAGMIESQAKMLLNELHQREVLSFEFANNDATITFLVPREDNHTISPIVPYIDSQSERKQRQITKFLSYIKNDDTCKMLQLLRYFGESDVDDCGMCSVCMSNSQDNQKNNIKDIKEAVFLQLKNKDCNSKELAEALNLSRTVVIETLKYLLKEELIIRTPEHTYKIL